MLRRFQNPHQKPVRLFHPGADHQPAIELVAGAGEVFEVDLAASQPCPHVLNELTTGRKSVSWDVSWLAPAETPAVTRATRPPAAAETASKES